MSRAATKLERVKCEGCGRVVECSVTPGGWCIARCACKSSWPTPCDSGAKAIAVWGRATPEQPR